MRDPKKEKKALKELRKKLRSLSSKDHVEGFFKLGRFACRKVLADGTVVQFSITEPAHRARPQKNSKTLPAPKRETKVKSNHAATNGA